MQSFEEIFGFPPTVRASAPGRVNLLGEHTDYNEGFVLPTAIPQRTVVELSLSRDGNNHCYATRMSGMVSILPGSSPPAGFGSYVFGCLTLLAEEGFDLGPVTLWVHSDVPMGAGLSSSAALEVAVLRGARELFELELDDVRLAQLAQQAEIRYAGVNCGIMDQMASSLADTEHMLFLDTRSLERKLLPFPPQGELLVIHSGLPRALSASAYNLRRRECEEAAARLGVAALRDVSDVAATDLLPDPLARRARHVVSEDNRVLEAAKGVAAARFGELMNASHQSLRDDFEVSIAAVDLLVELLQQSAGIYGARMTGAGFGGACVALAEKGAGRAAAEAVLEDYGRKGHRGKLIVC